ncbi:MAG: hypothetical protein A3H02_01675 [Candidatus Niyogibacteria bacterium RIFCSPLOWO2_12_FULL_41_13]|uniref:Uncharacterized protein n=1 Tax=Candidatus Niyogibacteria bacterium RIFCSPLOWO2_12_FULL_41_13 TaxID=1801726 RepID=A0A1G2F117_9BACT|nr:MAG: hypothetical protein A3H02_01675 [Candidatus Niyogibacteria bacterium RIFCSPLOWO2_12_FULL_41_13]
MNLKSKIFSGKIIIGLLIFVLLFNLFPFSVFAQGPPQNQPPPPQNDSGSWVWDNVKEIWNWVAGVPGKVVSAALGEVGDWINWGLAHFLSFFLWLASWLVALAGLVFDWVLDFNLEPTTFDPINFGGFVYSGWTYVRDTVNLLFIFILLIIAIGTIIGQESYGVKKALPTLIIIILLINFSLLFSRYVIEFSNSLADYIYTTRIEKLQTRLVREGRVGNSVFGRTLTLEEKLVNANLRKVSISSMMMEGLSAQKIRDAKLDQNASFIATAASISIGTILGIFVFITAAITFLVAAIMLFLRIVTLWLAMILAPAALFLWALPATEGYGKEWMMILIRQSIFLPVLIFMLSLAVHLSLNINNVFPTANNPLDISMINTQEGLITFVARYILLIIVFNAALVFARSLAEKGTGAIYSYASQAQGYMNSKVGIAGKWAGGKAWQGASYWPQYGVERGWGALKGRITRPAELDEKGKFKLDEKTGKAIDKGGILERTLGWAAPGQMAEIRGGIQKGIEERSKIFNQYGNYDLKKIHERRLTTPEERIAIEEVLASRKDMTGLSSKYIEQSIEKMKSAGRSAGVIERMGYQWAEPKSPALLKSFKNMRPSTIADVAEEGGEALTRFRRNLDVIGKSAGVTVNDIKTAANAFENIGNQSMANLLKTKRGEELYGSYFS